jgi:hypothetical protein
VGSFFFEGTVTYLNMFQTSNVPTIHMLYEHEKFYFQLDGVPPHFHCDVRGFHDETFPNQWICHRGSDEYLHIHCFNSTSLLLVGTPEGCGVQ